MEKVKRGKGKGILKILWAPRAKESTSEISTSSKNCFVTNRETEQAISDISGKRVRRKGR